METQNVSCIILAGGKGSRMGGADKGLVPFFGKPMIEHVIERIQPQVDDIVISANRNLETYKKYTPNVVSDEVDDYPGPMAGIAAALPLCKHELVLVVACDMPMLPNDLVNKLLAVMDNNDACITRQAGQLQLLFIIRKPLHSSIKNALDQGEYKLMRWLKQQLAVIEVDTVVKLNNINSTQDLNNYNS